MNNALEYTSKRLTSQTITEVVVKIGSSGSVISGVVEQDDHVRKAPHLVGKAPHLVGKAPHLVGKAPHLVGKAPHLVGKVLI